MSSLVDRIKKKREEQAAAGGSVESVTVEEGAQEAKPAAASQSSAVLQRMNEDRRDLAAVILLVDQIDVEPQARRTFKNIDRLAANIKKRGQIQPIVVIQIGPHRFRLKSGERRLRAIRDELQQDTIFARIVPDDESAAELRLSQLSENIHREDYEAMELAEEFQRLINEFDWTHEELAELLHSSKSWVNKKLSLLKAPPEVQELIRSGQLAETAYFNNKDAVLAEIQNLKKEEQGAAKIVGEGSGEGDRVATPRAKPEGQAPDKPKTISIPFTDAVRIAGLFKRLAEKHGLNPIEMSDEPSKKELMAILGRILDIKEVE